MLQNFSDIHLRVSDISQSILFPGPHPVDLKKEGLLGKLEALCRACEPFSQDDFTITFDEIHFRVRRETRVVDGAWYRLRRIQTQFPTLDTLPTPLPPAVTRLLLSDRLRGGGLIYISGAPGNGKTTTASAALVSRLRRYGGVAYTIEDPPEMLLHGWHGRGFCSQTAVGDDSDWAKSFRGALRSQPANTPAILYVGEVRDADSAQALLRAAANGFLAIATGFGADIVSSIESYLRLAGSSQDVQDAFSNVFRLALHQQLVNGRLQAKFLVSTGGASPTASKIRAGQFRQLIDDVEQQSVQAMQGQDLLVESHLRIA